MSKRRHLGGIQVSNMLSRVQLFVVPWTVTHQAPLSMGFSRQEYWSVLSSLFQGIFLTQGSNLCLLHLLLDLNQKPNNTSQISLDEDSLLAERTPCRASHHHLLKAPCLVLHKEHPSFSLSEIGTPSPFYRWENWCWRFRNWFEITKLQSA